MKFLRNKWLPIVVSLIAMCAIPSAVLLIICARYDVTGSQDFGYASPHVGALTVIYGRPRVNGKPTLHNWLYLMIVCRGVRATGGEASGINSDIGWFPVFYSEWETTNGTVHVPFRWNQWTDTIMIGEQKFKRMNGNVFVVVREADGRLMTRQCGSLGPSADLPEIVQHIRKQLPTDDLVTSVKFFHSE